MCELEDAGMLEDCCCCGLGLWAPPALLELESTMVGAGIGFDRRVRMSLAENSRS